MKTQDLTKPVGVWEVRRRIQIPALVQAADTAAMESTLSTLAGFRKMAADVEKHQIIVRYDASQSDYQSIVDVLENTGFPPLDNWWGRFKGSWFEYCDTNARDNAKAPSPPCCNKPPR